VSTPALVIAQCKAGIVGSIPALNARPKEMLKDWIAEIKEALSVHDQLYPDSPSAPFAINQIAHRTNDRLDYDMHVIAEAQIPIVIVSLRLMRMSAPVVATVQGDVAGGSVSLVASADIVFAAETVRFSAPLSDDRL
jgi:NAD(P)H-dependent flavin oxidoreductase YrpB (nitropropane dioxygenase family)